MKKLKLCKRKFDFLTFQKLVLSKCQKHFYILVITN